MDYRIIKMEEEEVCMSFREGLERRTAMVGMLDAGVLMMAKLGAEDVWRGRREGVAMCLGK